MSKRRSKRQQQRPKREGQTCPKMQDKDNTKKGQGEDVQGRSRVKFHVSNERGALMHTILQFIRASGRRGTTPESIARQITVQGKAPGEETVRAVSQAIFKNMTQKPKKGESRKRKSIRFASSADADLPFSTGIRGAPVWDKAKFCLADKAYWTLDSLFAGRALLRRAEREGWSNNGWLKMTTIVSNLSTVGYKTKNNATEKNLFWTVYSRLHNHDLFEQRGSGQELEFRLAHDGGGHQADKDQFDFPEDVQDFIASTKEHQEGQGTPEDLHLATPEDLHLATPEDLHLATPEDLLDLLETTEEQVQEHQEDVARGEDHEDHQEQEHEDGDNAPTLSLLSHQNERAPPLKLKELRRILKGVMNTELQTVYEDCMNMIARWRTAKPRPDDIKSVLGKVRTPRTTLEKYVSNLVHEEALQALLKHEKNESKSPETCRKCWFVFFSANCVNCVNGTPFAKRLYENWELYLQQTKQIDLPKIECDFNEVMEEIMKEISTSKETASHAVLLNLNRKLVTLYNEHRDKVREKVECREQDGLDLDRICTVRQVHPRCLPTCLPTTDVRNYGKTITTRRCSTWLWSSFFPSDNLVTFWSLDMLGITTKSCKAVALKNNDLQHKNKPPLEHVIELYQWAKLDQKLRGTYVLRGLRELIQSDGREDDRTDIPPRERQTTGSSSRVTAGKMFEHVPCPLKSAPDTPQEKTNLRELIQSDVPFTPFTCLSAPKSAPETPYDETYEKILRSLYAWEGEKNPPEEYKTISWIGMRIPDLEKIIPEQDDEVSESTEDFKPRKRKKIKRVRRRL